jgi:hypothetical protein
MADKDTGKAKGTLPAGATNMHKNMAVGMSKDAATAKATNAQVEPKPR